MEKRGRRRIPEMDKRRTKVKCETCRFVQDVEQGIGYCPVIKMLSRYITRKFACITCVVIVVI